MNASQNPEPERAKKDPESGVRFFVVGEAQIGDFSYVSEMTHISHKTVIGKFCSIGNLCTLGAQQHKIDGLSSFQMLRLGAIGNEPPADPPQTTIGNDVWIGCNAVVMSGLTVGDGAVIGGGTVVTKDVPPYAIVVGNPARVLRYRFSPEIISELLELRWWDRPAQFIVSMPHDDIEACLAILREHEVQRAVL